METFNIYKIEKQRLLDKIAKLNELLIQLNKLNLDCNEEMDKLQKVINTIQNDIINIVLVGSFSDGKTSLIAGWLDEEKPDMKIDPDESSDEILVYKSDFLPEYCKIIDTPGLFGDKEDAVSHNKLSEKTEKYIDQATIIIYVTESGNPIKDSHKDLLKWILNDLHKLDNTIFIINKMDEVSDLTDNSEFLNMSLEKKKTLKNKLKEISNLSDSDLDKLHILCLSTDPQKKGIPFWHEHRDEYETRSRIKTLEQETNLILSENTVSSLVNKTGYDVVNQMVTEKLNVVQNQMEIIDDVLPKLEESLRRNEKDYKHAEEQILKIRPKFQKKLRESEDKLIRQLNQTTLEDIGDFIDTKIGIEGERFIDEINYITEDFFNQTSNKILSNLQKKIEHEVNIQNEIYEDRIKKGGEAAANALKAAGKMPANEMKQFVFAARDIINKIFGANIKFKPWQALKIAEGVGKGLGIAGAGLDVGIEIFEAIKRDRDNVKLEKTKSKIKEDVIKNYKYLMDMINDNDTYLEHFAPQLKSFNEQLECYREEIKKQNERRKAYADWKKNVIDAEFKVLYE